MPEHNENFWKDIYQNTWGAASDTEEQMAAIIYENTGHPVTGYGLGAGSTEYIEGSAEANGHKKGDADLHVEGTNIYIEVTGPLSKFVDRNADLWFRPDKIENAIMNLGSHDTFLAHYLPKEDLWRIIHIDDEFIARYRKGEFPTYTEIIRGQTETYTHVPSTYHRIGAVRHLNAYINRLWHGPKET